MSFGRYQAEDSIVSVETITSALWSGDQTTISSGSFFTSSNQAISDNGKFYVHVYNAPVGNTGSELQFSIAYGHISGSGSAPFNTQIPGNTPSRNVYGQYRTMLLGDEGARFNFGGNNGFSEDIAVISVSRARYKESINPGTFNLRLVNGSNVINLTDNSKDNLVTSYIGTTKVFNIVSGSDGRSHTTSSVQTPSGSYGLFFPEVGTIILNLSALALAPSGSSGGIGLSLNRTGSLGYTLPFNANVANIYSLIANGQITGRSEETLSARYFFTRIKNAEFNYTTNPSIIDANGNILFPSMVNSPDVFITSMGLYNDNNELLAVAKFSRPIKKNFVKELLFQVKLDF